MTDIREELAEITRELYDLRLVTGTGGNISARDPQNAGNIWITPSAVFKGGLLGEDMVSMGLDGELIGENAYPASSERYVHTAIYKARPDIQAVVHSHAQQATLLALTNTPLLPIGAEAALVGELPVVPFILPGTQELGSTVAIGLGDGNAVLMQNHGLVVAASDLRRAADLTAIIEVTAEKLMICRQLGIDPPVLPPDAVEKLRKKKVV